MEGIEPRLELGLRRVRVANERLRVRVFPQHRNVGLLGLQQLLVHGVLVDLALLACMQVHLQPALLGEQQRSVAEQILRGLVRQRLLRVGDVLLHAPEHRVALAFKRLPAALVEVARLRVVEVFVYLAAVVHERLDRVSAVQVVLFLARLREEHRRVVAKPAAHLLNRSAHLLRLAASVHVERSDGCVVVGLHATWLKAHLREVGDLDHQACPPPIMRSK